MLSKLHILYLKQMTWFSKGMNACYFHQSYSVTISLTGKSGHVRRTNFNLQYFIYGSEKFHFLFSSSSVTLLNIILEGKEIMNRLQWQKNLSPMKYHTDSLESPFNFYTENVMHLGIKQLYGYSHVDITHHITH